MSPEPEKTEKTATTSTTETVKEAPPTAADPHENIGPFLGDGAARWFYNDETKDDVAAALDGMAKWVKDSRC